MLESIIDKLHEFKLQVQEFKIESDVDPTEVRNWTQEFENEVAEFEGIAKQAKVAASSIKSEEEEKLQEIKRKRAIEEGIELEKAKYEVKMNFEAEKLASGGGAGAKLPKLVITKFQGTHLDWMRFWNQYETEIDKSNITQVAKLSYLRELLVPSAKVLIEGLPFTSEGYERAKTILKTKYGQVSEVVSAHIQCILELPKVQGTDPSKLHKFYRHLTRSEGLCVVPSISSLISEQILFVWMTSGNSGITLNLWSPFVSGVTVTLKKPVVEVDLTQRKVKHFKHLPHLNLMHIVMPKITNQLSAKKLVM